ncbi:MAG: shikimate kinase [Bacteroidales bacterium]|nr:shikimate kinase [Bacteroidales bacterium]
MERVFLIGYMGCGKSTIGRYIAKDMGWRFIDMDDYVEQRIGCTISQYFAKAGEQKFRAAAAAALKSLAEEKNVIVATGGGSPCHFDNMDVMRKAGLTIYIKVEPSALAARLKGAKAQRPIIAQKSDDELEAFIAEQLKIREPFYSRAEMSVDGERLPFSDYKPFIESFAAMNG